MKTSITIISSLLLLAACTAKVPYGQTVTMDDATLMDKIKGGWYGQTIGCTYGGPTEFKYKGGLMMDEIPIPWYDDYIYDTFIEDPVMAWTPRLTSMPRLSLMPITSSGTPTRQPATTSLTGGEHRKAATGSTTPTQTT